jgi:ribosomal protein S18 acetylase RimI-like enzyme
LQYLSSEIGSFPTAWRWGDREKLITWSDEVRPVFERAILSSYEGTLDCPGLLGLRQIGDVIAGHMASACFVPELWFALVEQGEARAVMLLNVIPQRNAVELTYLGVGVAWRGRGYGRMLLEHGFYAAKRYGAGQVLLAVDRSNTPALRLYERMGFSGDMRKLALIFVLR